MTLDKCVRNFTRFTGCSLGEAIKCATYNPARCLGIEHRKGTLRPGADADLIVLDEPTTGLHLADVAAMLEMLDRLVDDGRTVIAVEHHQAVMAHADWIIDLGPGAGADGGRVVFEGAPADLVAQSRSGEGTLTGEYLAAYVAGPEA